MKSLCYVNGEIMPASDGVIGISDLALQRGYGVFDFGRTYNGKLFHFGQNIKRFRRSASALHLAVPVSDEEIGETVLHLIDESDLKIPCIRMLLTGGYSSTLENPNFIIIAEELPTYPAEVYSNGVKIITVEYQRELPHVKTINYLNMIRLDPFMKEKKAFDMLYYSQIGITECPRSNFFAFLGDTLVTPADFVLLGNTRRIVLELAADHFAVEERRISLEELGDIDEAFLTSTTKGIVPVSTIDDRKIGNGFVGERTKKMMSLFDSYVEAY
jgi:D-alanine transaminase/branched-chain amino acid aminotransferase